MPIELSTARTTPAFQTQSTTTPQAKKVSFSPECKKPLPQRELEVKSSTTEFLESLAGPRGLIAEQVQCCVQ